VEALRLDCALSRTVAWLTIKRSGEERQYRDIAQGEVAQVVEQFEAIGEDPEKFKAFLSRAA
jgi:hypothetical protein